MAEFCSRCEPEGFDIDIVQLSNELKPGYSIDFLCEGCNMRGMYKDEYGLLYLAIWKSGQIEVEKVASTDMSSYIEN